MKIRWDNDKHKIIVEMSKREGWVIFNSLCGESKAQWIWKEFWRAFVAATKK